jgi:pilus assembly protein Flp/PilA
LLGIAIFGIDEALPVRASVQGEVTMVSNMINAMILKFLYDEDGATAVEYVLIVAAIAVVVVGGIAAFGGQLTTLFGNVTTAITPAAPGG